MKIGFDIDGVLANFEQSYGPLLTKLSGVTFPRMGQNNWPDTWFWERAAGVTAEQEDAAWTEIKQSPTFWASLPTTPECAHTIAALNDRIGAGDEVFFVTTRPGTFALSNTRDWLMAQGIANPDVTIASNSKEKGRIALRLGLEFFIDDKPSNCEAVFYDSYARVYLLDRPWNRDYFPNADIHRVSHPVIALRDFFTVTVPLSAVA